MEIGRARIFSIILLVGVCLFTYGIWLRGNPTSNGSPGLIGFLVLIGVDLIFTSFVYAVFWNMGEDR